MPSIVIVMSSIVIALTLVFAINTRINSNKIFFIIYFFSCISTILIAHSSVPNSWLEQGLDILKRFLNSFIYYLFTTSVNFINFHT